MGIFDAFKKKPVPELKEPPVTKTVAPKVKAAKKTAKEIATENGEPWVTIVNVELDPENIGNGAFELDWNDKFLAQLIRAGYQAKANEEESVIVDRWFQDVCRNVVLETFEQMEANNPRGIVRKEIGNGRSEFS